MRGQYSETCSLDDIGDPDAPPGSRAWALWAVHYAKMRREDLDKDAASLRRCITTIQEHEAWKVLGYPSFDMLCVTRLQLSSDEVNAVLTAPRGSTVGAVLGKVGRPKGGDNVDNINIYQGGTQVAYLAARLRRDFPDVQFDESIRGSVRKAAIECGIVKPLKTCVLSDPETVAEKIVEAMGADFARAVLGALAAKLAEVSLTDQADPD